MSATILIFGHDNLLFRSRCWLLESKGFTVQTAGTIEQVGQILGAEAIDLLILCQTLTAQECEDVLAIAKQVRPQMKKLLLNSAFPSGADGGLAVLGKFAEPQALITAVQKMTDVPTS